MLYVNFLGTSFSLSLSPLSCFAVFLFTIHPSTLLCHYLFVWFSDKRGMYPGCRRGQITALCAARFLLFEYLSPCILFDYFSSNLLSVQMWWLVFMAHYFRYFLCTSEFIYCTSAACAGRSTRHYLGILFVIMQYKCSNTGAISIHKIISVSEVQMALYSLCVL